MRKMTVLIECDERTLGSILADVLNRPHTKVLECSVISELPPTVNAKRQPGAGLSGFEVLQQVGAKGREFSTTEAAAAFDAAGLARSTLNGQLKRMREQGILKVISVGRGRIPGMFKLVGK